MIVKLQQQQGELYLEAETPHEGAQMAEFADYLRRASMLYQFENKPSSVRLVVGLRKRITSGDALEFGR